MDGTTKLTSKRIALRRESVEDIPTLFEELGCKFEITKYTGWNPYRTIGAYDYNAEDSSIEIGYSIFKSAWGNGFASEAVATVVEYLMKSEKIRAINAWCHSENKASIKVLEKANFKVTDIEKQSIRNNDGTFSDKVIMRKS